MAIGCMRFNQPFKSRLWRWAQVSVLICTVWLAGGESFAGESDMFVAQLSAKHTELLDQLLHNRFERALYLESAESQNDLTSEIYAVVEYPFAIVNTALNNPAHWCDVLILHINVKSCHASSSEAGTVLAIHLGRKAYQPLVDAFRLEFDYRAAITTQDYFALELNAKDGPLSTHDYRIRIEATPIDAGHTFLHFSYAYAFGTTGRLAMQSYLLTIGRDKVGFTITGKLPNGQPTYIQGVRGAVERNTMRYYLAIDAYLAALSTPHEGRLDARLLHWYNATEQYARQLHEVGRGDYLVMKRKEYRRQQEAQ